MNTDSLPGLSLEVFSSVQDRLAEEGIRPSEQELNKLASRVECGVRYLDRFRNWWLVIRKNGDVVIDVGSPVRAPYNLVIESFSHHPAAHFSSEKAVECGFIPQMLQSAEERRILNAFWNEWLDILAASSPYGN